MKPILLILTGGTICSFGDSRNLNRDVDMSKAKRLIIENFEKSSSAYKDTEFEVKLILDTLSENMTAAKWNTLKDYLKTVDFDRYQGVIMAHGTDTLAYTACFMSLIMSDKNIPVCMVSSQLPLNEEKANGNRNFSMAVNMIRQGIPAGVYVPYENMNGEMYIHKGAHLMQCADYLDDFYSSDCVRVNELNVGEYIKEVKAKKDIQDNNQGDGKFDSPRGSYSDGKNNSQRYSYSDGQGESHGAGYGNNFGEKVDLEKISKITGCVLYIKPYVGLDYSVYKIDNKIKAVVHGLYHSCTACVERSDKEQPYTQASILYLLDKCREHNIPVIVEPCHEDANTYVSGNDMTEAGAVPVYGMTSEMAYVKTLVGCAMGLENEELISFLKADVCGEYRDGK